MAGCGYVCPVCEGRGFLDDLSFCTYCAEKPKSKEITDQEWIDSVHNNSCCSDIGKDSN